MSSRILAKRGITLLTLGILVPASASPPAAAQSFSPPAGPFLFRPSGSIAALAVATPVWVGVATDPHELLGDFRFLPPWATEDTRGQVFHILESDVSERLSEGGSFIAVPWTLGCGCAEEGWGDTVWVAPGDTVAFLLTPTRGKALEGPPVFDVLGWHQPFPAGEMIPYWRHERRLNPDWIGPREFFELLQRLPSEARFRLAPEAAYEEVLAWIAEVPGREDRFPVTTLLQDWRARAELPSRHPHPAP